MKTLLINPPFNIQKENYDSSLSVGLLSIASCLYVKNIKVKIIDGVRQKNFLDLIKEKVADTLFVGLSVMTTQIPAALEISELIRKINPNCKIIWGGIHPTFFIKETIANDLVDIIVFGEGEETLSEIMQGKNLEEIRGIAYKKNGDIVVNEARELSDLAKMSLLNWDLVPREILDNIKLIPSLTSRGCPHRCTFCVNAILKNKWRPRTVEQVLEDLRIIKNRKYFKDKKLRFWDENFFVDLKRAKLIIDGMLEEQLIIPWETTVRANYLNQKMINDDFLEKMKHSGCYLLSFGAESGSQKILDKIQKDITPEDILESAKMCLRHNIIPQYSFMIGLPGEEKGDMMMTLKLIDKLIKLDERVQILGPQAFRPYPGSPLFAECVKFGWHSPRSLGEWNEYVKNELNYLDVKSFPWVKEKKLVESMEAYVRFGAHSIKSAMGSSVKAQRFVKLAFVLICKIRWKIKFFYWPIEFRLAKKYVTK